MPARAVGMHGSGYRGAVVLLSLSLLTGPTPEMPRARVELSAAIESGRVVLHDLSVDGGTLDHVDRVVLDPVGELEIELPDERAWSFAGGDMDRTWHLVVHGLPIQEPEVAQLDRVALPLEVTAPWPTRPWWPAPALALAVALAVARTRTGARSPGHR